MTFPRQRLSRASSLSLLQHWPLDQPPGTSTVMEKSEGRKETSPHCPGPTPFPPHAEMHPPRSPTGQATRFGGWTKQAGRRRGRWTPGCHGLRLRAPQKAGSSNPGEPLAAPGRGACRPPLVWTCATEMNRAPDGKDKGPGGRDRRNTARAYLHPICPGQARSGQSCKAPMPPESENSLPFLFVYLLLHTFCAS